MRGVTWHRRPTYEEDDGLNLDASQLRRFIYREFRTVERPSVKELSSYLGMAWRSREPLSRRITQMMKVFAHACSEHASCWRRARSSPLGFDLRWNSTSAARVTGTLCSGGDRCES